MTDRCVPTPGVLAVAFAVFVVTPAFPQTQTAPQRGAAGAYAAPKMPWGDPDLQGVWGGRHQTTTPLERPKEFSGREFLTDEEVAVRQRAENELQAKKSTGGDFVEVGRRELKESPIAGNEYNTFWVDTGAPARVFRQTSLIVGPEGRIPYRPEVAKRIAFSAVVVSSNPPADFENNSWADRDMGERCITDAAFGMVWSGTGPSQIFQGPGYVIFEGEQFRDRRIIPTDGRPHGTIRGTLGEAVGHWEGNTLVVETKNFTDKTQNWPRDRFAQEYRTPTATMHLMERFTRTAVDTIQYEVTVTDPSKFTKPWTVSYPFMRSAAESIFLEYACHEGNYGMLHLLSQARNVEKQQSSPKGTTGAK